MSYANIKSKTHKRVPPVLACHGGSIKSPVNLTKPLLDPVSTFKSTLKSNQFVLPVNKEHPTLTSTKNKEFKVGLNGRSCAPNDAKKEASESEFTLLQKTNDFLDEHDRVTAKIVDIVEDAVAVSNAQSGKIEELKNALGNTQGELAQANGRVSECNVEIGHLKKDMLGLGKELTEAKSLIATQQKDIDKMVEHSNEAKTKLFEAKAELRDLESTRDKLAQANDLVKEYKNHFAALETILGDELTDDNNLVEFVKETNLKATKKTIEAFILKHMLDQAKAETLELKKRIHHALIVSIVVLAIFLTPWVPAHGFARFVVGLLVLLLSWDHFLN